MINGKSMKNHLIKTDLRGKIYNLNDFKSEALLPVFEAVINSIHAIEDRKYIEKGEIRVKIIRERTIQTDFSTLKSINNKKSKDENIITGFDIVDNGIGFTPENLNSFETSDSTYKLERGGKGVGRFFWLKAFDKVKIESVYLDEENIKKKRSFNFTINDIIDKHVDNEVDSNTPQRTIVHLKGFKEKYRSGPSAYKKIETIALRILEHCLTYYIGEIAPRIVIEDDNGSIHLSELYNKIRGHIKTENIEISGNNFSINHIKLYDTHEKVHKIVYCADNRDVVFDKLDKLLGTSAHFDEDDKKFIYSVYVSGDYLDNHVNVSRTDFDFPRSSKNRSLNDSELSSLDIIRNTVIERSKEYLSDYLIIVQKRKEEKISEHIESNPSLRSIPYYCPEVVDEIEVNSTTEKINEVLYKYKGKSELKIKKDTEKLLRTQVDSIQEIEDECNELNERISNFQKDDLAQYLIKRKMIIGLVEKKLQFNKDDKYHLESIIHDIIFPRYTSSDQLSYNDHNLWIINENLAYHQYAASDKRLCDFSNSDDETRPDIIILDEKDENHIAKSISIIELKRPQRDTLDQSPIEQMYNVIREIKDKKIKRENGRDIHVDSSTKFNCFAICDITDSIKEDAENKDFIKLEGNLGYYNYNKSLNAFVEVLAFDQLINDVKKRHKIFFEKLGI